MSSAATPPRPSPAARALVGLTRVSLRHPYLVLALAVAVTVAAAVYLRGLQLRTSKFDLVPQDDPVATRFLAFLEDFDAPNLVLAVVEGDDARAAADALAARARGLETVGMARSRIDRDAYRDQFLATLEPSRRKDLKVALDAGRLDLRALAEDPEVATLLERWTRPGRLEDAPGAQRLEALAAMMEYLAEGHAEGVPDPRLLLGGGRLEETRGLVDAQGYLVSHDGRAVLVRAASADASDSHDVLTPFMRDLERAAAEVEAARRVRIRFSGFPALKVAEKEAAEWSVSRSAGFSLVGVVGLFLVVFAKPALPLLSVGCLLLAMLWTTAWAKASVGHLTVVSSSFTAILIGLGVDFAIHLLSHYEEQRTRGAAPVEAMTAAAEEAAPGIVTGGVTTSAAFFTMVWTGFPAFRGLGIIAGGGLLLALVETFSVLPAAVIAWDRDDGGPRPAPPMSAFFQRLGGEAERLPGLGPLVAAALFLTCLAPSWKLGFDTNFLAMNDPRSEPIRLQAEMLERFGFFPLVNAVLVEDSEALHRAAAKAAAAPSVGLTDSLAPRLARQDPGLADDKRAIAAHLADLPPLAPAPAPDSARRARAATRLAQQMEKLRIYYLAELDRPAAAAAARTAEALRAIAGADPGAVQARERQLIERLGEALADLRASAEAPPVALADLPPEDTRRYKDAGGRLALYLSPRADVRRPEEAQRFNRETAEVAAHAGGALTGNVLLSEHMMSLLERGYHDTVLYSLAAILLLVTLDLPSLALIGLVMATVGLGLVMTRASMVWAGVTLNPANFIAVPLLFGIGVDNAVHMAQPWRRGEAVASIVAHSGRPIVINAMTSMLGFGGLLVARHEGLYSLGWALAAGVLWCCLASLLLVPGVLAMMNTPRQAWGAYLADAASHRPGA